MMISTFLKKYIYILWQINAKMTSYSFIIKHIIFSLSNNNDFKTFLTHTNKYKIEL